MGLDQRQRQDQQRQRQPESALLLHTEPPQEIQRRKQHAPAQQGGPLGHQQIHDRVHPQDVLLGVVGGGGVVPGKDGGKIRRAACKVEESEPAAHKKQPVPQAGPGCAAKHPPRQLPGHAVYRRQRRNQRQQVGGAQPGAQHQENAGHRLTQKRVSQAEVPRQHRVHRREDPAHRDALDVGQVQRQVAVAALPGVVGPVHLPQNVGVQQPDGQRQQRQHAGPLGGVPRVPPQQGQGSAPPPAAPQQYRRRQRQRTGQQHRRQPKTQRQGRQRRQGGQAAHTEGAAQRQYCPRRSVGQRPAGRQPSGCQKYRQVCQTGGGPQK